MSAQTVQPPLSANDSARKSYKAVSSGGIGHLEAGIPMLAGQKSSHAPALAVERWGKVLCKVSIQDVKKTAALSKDTEWNFAMTDATIALYTDDGENCKLFPRRMIQMVDLIDTDEIVVKVSKTSYYLRKIVGTLLVIVLCIALDELFASLYGAGVLKETLPPDMYEPLKSYTSPWWLLVLLPLLPLCWCLVGCCIPAPYADVFKGSKLTLVTGATTTSFRMQDSDLPAIQEFLDDPSGSSKMMRR